MLKQLEGSRGVAEAVAMSRPEVICAYPITPQTHIVEALSAKVKAGELAAEFLNVESEFAAMSVAIGASAAGARAYTATASQGLLYMCEAVYNASGLGLPIVMTVANRAIGAPINIWNDHSDSMSQRDSGWIQLFAETNQEALDLHIQAFRIAEELSTPVMVCMDGFLLTHASERMDIPGQEQVDAFLPPYQPRQVLDPADPISIGAMVGPEAFTEVRYLSQARLLQALDLVPAVAAEFLTGFGRDSGGLVRAYRTEDADLIVVALGSVLGTIKDAVDELRDEGLRIGVLGITTFRPFPAHAVREALAGASRLVVIERAISPGQRRHRDRRRSHRAGRGARPRDLDRGGRPRRPGRHPQVAAADAAERRQRSARADELPRPRHRPDRARTGPDAGHQKVRPERGEPAPRPGRHRSGTDRRPGHATGADQVLPDRQFRGRQLAAADRRRSVQSLPERSNALTCGHRACQGCGEALGARYALDTVMRATKGKLIAVNATGCLEVFSTPFPETSWQIAWLHSLFGNAPAVATGVAAALRAKGRTDVRVVGQGGDGGTVDIGLGCLSGMFERNDDVLYVCYDNQAYMNTGVQRSGATPPAARTATTQAVGDQPGNTFGQGKNVPLIAMAHQIPYVATATVADLRDLEYKAARAMDFHGARYLHVLVPCPLGWGSSPADTIRVARLATESGLFPVFEATDGEVVGAAPIRRQVPVGGLPAAPGPLRASVPAGRADRDDRQDPGHRRPQHLPLRAASGDSGKSKPTKSWHRTDPGLRLRCP